MFVCVHSYFYQGLFFGYGIRGDLPPPLFMETEEYDYVEGQILAFWTLIML